MTNTWALLCNLRKLLDQKKCTPTVEGLDKCSDLYTTLEFRKKTATSSVTESFTVEIVNLVVSRWLCLFVCLATFCKAEKKCCRTFETGTLKLDTRYYFTFPSKNGLILYTEKKNEQIQVTASTQKKQTYDIKTSKAKNVPWRRDRKGPGTGADSLRPPTPPGVFPQPQMPLDVNKPPGAPRETRSKPCRS